MTLVREASCGGIPITTATVPPVSRNQDTPRDASLSTVKVCACGCGQRVKRGATTWASRSCVPLSVRVEGGRKGGQRQAVNHKWRLFRDEIKRLEQCRPMTRGDLLASFDAIHQRALHTRRQRRGWA